MFAAAYPGRDVLDETVATFIGMLNAAPVAHLRISGKYDRDAKDYDDMRETNRELAAEKQFPALAEDWSI